MGETHASDVGNQDTGLPIAVILATYPTIHATSVVRWVIGQAIVVDSEGFDSYSRSNLLYSA